MAKVTVSFVTADDMSKMTIESDPDRNKDYTGRTKTKFRYGDTAYFRVYSHEPEKIKVSASDGELADMGIYTTTIADEILPFITEQTADTEKPVKKISGYTWLGNSLGSVTAYDSYSVQTSSAPTGDMIATLSLTYQTSYRLFGLTLAKRDISEYPVIVYVRSGDV